MDSLHYEEKWIRRLFLLTDCLFNGNELRILGGKKDFLCKFCILGGGNILRDVSVILCIP